MTPWTIGAPQASLIAIEALIYGIFIGFTLNDATYDGEMMKAVIIVGVAVAIVFNGLLKWGGFF